MLSSGIAAIAIRDDGIVVYAESGSAHDKTVGSISAASQGWGIQHVVVYLIVVPGRAVEAIHVEDGIDIIASRIDIVVVELHAVRTADIHGRAGPIC